MKPFISLLLASLLSVSARADQVAIVKGTLINPGSGQVVQNATIVIEGDEIVAAGPAEDTPVAKDAKIIDAGGKFILPGYIDTHVHFFQSGGLYARPDVVDLTKVRPYATEIAMVKKNLPDTFARYLRSGITAVVDIGGPMWNFEVRKIAAATAKAPHVAVAGPLISSVSRPQLDLGDPPIVKIDTPEQGRAFVQKLARQKPDFIKIWYIVNAEHPVAAFRPVVRAVVAESHARKLRVAVHATELEAARAAVEEGADLLVHSVTDKPVDDAFVRLLREHGTILTPTLVVFERYGLTFTQKLALTAPEKNWGNPEVIATLSDISHMPKEQLPERLQTALAKPDAVLAHIKKTEAIAQQNLKTLADAGVMIAAGTDAGNIGTIHGPAIFREFQLMHQAGLTPMEILRSTTTNGAQVFGGETGGKIGAIAPGHLADLVILNSNPVEDIANASDIKSVMKGGVLYSAADLIR